jgi:hypothetical protein
MIYQKKPMGETFAKRRFCPTFPRLPESVSHLREGATFFFKLLFVSVNLELRTQRWRLK